MHHLSMIVVLFALGGLGCSPGPSTQPTTAKPPPSTTPQTPPPDDVSAAAAAGFANGNWKVYRGADQALLMELDLIHDQGSSLVEGTFVLGPTYNTLAGRSEELLEASYDDERLVLRLQPGPQREQIYTIDASSVVDPQTLGGRLSASLGSRDEGEVVLRRGAPRAPTADESSETPWGG